MHSLIRRVIKQSRQRKDCRKFLLRMISIKMWYHRLHRDLLSKRRCKGRNSNSTTHRSHRGKAMNLSARVCSLLFQKQRRWSTHLTESTSVQELLPLDLCIQRATKKAIWSHKREAYKNRFKGTEIEDLLETTLSPEFHQNLTQGQWCKT